MSYVNLKEDARLIWSMVKVRLSDGVSMLDVTLIVTTLLEAIKGMSAYMDETNPVEKKRVALALVDEIYEVEIKPKDLAPWGLDEEMLDKYLGKIIHWAAAKALDALLGE